MFLFNIIVIGGSSIEDGDIVFCAFDTFSLPNPYSPISADGSFIYCAYDVNSLSNPYDPISADGTIIFCSQDTSGL